jgi:hypothetical protein
LTSGFAERLRAVPWERVAEALGDARAVPDALLRLAAASEPGEVDAAYWRLDNHVVLQGTLSEAAYHLVPFLLELLEDRSRFSRRALYDLLAEIALGQSPPGDPGDLRRACRDRVRAGLGLVRDDLLAPGTDPAVRERALDVLVAVERDRAALLDTLRRVPGTGDAALDARIERVIRSRT